MQYLELPACLPHGQWLPGHNMVQKEIKSMTHFNGQKSTVQRKQEQNEQRFVKMVKLKI